MNKAFSCSSSQCPKVYQLEILSVKNSLYNLKTVSVFGLFDIQHVSITLYTMISYICQGYLREKKYQNICLPTSIHKFNCRMVKLKLISRINVQMFKNLSNYILVMLVAFITQKCPCCRGTFYRLWKSLCTIGLKFRYAIFRGYPCHVKVTRAYFFYLLFFNIDE